MAKPHLRLHYSKRVHSFGYVGCDCAWHIECALGSTEQFDTAREAVARARKVWWWLP